MDRRWPRCGLASADHPSVLPVFNHFRGTALIPYPFSQTEFVGFTDASGVLERTVSLGLFAPGVESAPLFWQFYYLDLNRNRSPQTSGHARRALTGYQIGAGTMIVGLDGSF